MKTKSDKCPNNFSFAVITKALALFLGVVVLLSPLSANGQETLSDLPGRIKTFRGEGVPGVNVTATHRVTGRSYTTITDERGYYIFRQIPVGRYRIKSEYTGFAAKIIEVALTVGQNNIIETIFGSDVELAVGNLEGVIIDEEKQAISDARVKITNRATKEVIEVSTDAQGKYELKDLAAGKYDIQVSKEGFVTETDDFKIKGGKLEKENFKLEKSKTAETAK